MSENFHSSGFIFEVYNSFEPILEAFGVKREMRLEFGQAFLCPSFCSFVLQSKRECFPKLDAIKSATADIVSQFIFLYLL